MFTIELKTLLISSSILGLIASYFAIKQNRNYFIWFLLGFMFGTVTLIVLFFLKPPKKEEKQTATIPTLTNTIKDSKFWYYLNKTKTEVGPLSSTKLISLYKNGVIFDNTFVWNEDLENWLYLKNTKAYDLYLQKTIEDDTYIKN
jgi:hypothetical protein